MTSSAALWMALTLATSGDTATCGRVSLVEGRRDVFVLLIGGHPVGPGLPELQKVASDIAVMSDFFEVLAPVSTYMHVSVTDAVARELQTDRVKVRAPTFDALRVTVQQLLDEIDRRDAERTDIYIYYAGHGKLVYRDQRPATSLFLHGGDGGYEVLGSDDLMGQVVEPLARPSGSSVHLIVDACQSFYVMEPRGPLVRRVPKLPSQTDSKLRDYFVATYPNVGAALATSGAQLTWETAKLGGQFSHAVRSAAAGLGDLDNDGVVTYREADHAIREVLGKRALESPPAVVAPSGDPDAPLIDYRRATHAVQICFEATGQRYRLFNAASTAYATTNPPLGARSSIFVTPSRTYTLAEDRGSGAPSFTTFSATVSAWLRDLDRSATRPQGALERDGLLLRPMSSKLEEEIAAPPPLDLAERYLEVGGRGVVGIAPGLRKVGLDVLPGAQLDVRLGLGGHQIIVAGQWNAKSASVPQRSLFYDATRWALGAGYQRVVYADRVEIMAGVQLDVGRIRQELDTGDVSSATDLRATALGEVLWPLFGGSLVAVSGQLRAGALGLCVDGCAERLDSLFIEGSLGLLFEIPVR